MVADVVIAMLLVGNVSVNDSLVVAVLAMIVLVAEIFTVSNKSALVVMVREDKTEYICWSTISSTQ